MIGMITTKINGKTLHKKPHSEKNVRGEKFVASELRNMSIQ